MLVVACAAATAAMGQPAKQRSAQLIAAHGTSPSVAVCVGCHGAKGEGIGAFPRLGGTGQAYLAAQLDAFANGDRKNPVMQTIAQSLKPAERQALALYFSQLSAPFVASDSAQTSPSDTGAWLAIRGRWTNQVPACAQCHGPGGNGVGAHFPPLAGLPAAYIVEQLQAWKAGNRPSGPLALMAGVAEKLSTAEISAVAAYYEKIAAPDRTTAPRAVSGVPGAAVTIGALNSTASAPTKGPP